MSNNVEAPREPDDLFNKGQVRHGETPASLEVEVRVLPLGAFSEFVLIEQPRLLTSVKAGSIGVDTLIERQKELLVGVSPETVEMAVADPTLASFAMLDLTFAINAAVLAENPPSGSRPPDEVEQLSVLFTQVTGLPRTMTFEKIVGINSRLPYQQMRTFTDGEVGETERMFYYGHDLMGKILGSTTQVASETVTLLTTFGKQKIGEVEASLVRAAAGMNEFSDFMIGFMRMPTEHFTIFRQYISQYPDGTRNASGAFIGMPRLNLRLMGSASFYEDFLNEGMQYFPVGEQQDIQQARIDANKDNYLVAICERLQGVERIDLSRMLKQLIEPLHQFRLLHFAAALKYIPGAIPEGGKDLKTLLMEDYESILDDQPDVVKGTGGFISGPLLRNILRLDLRSLERLEKIINNEDS